MPNAVAAKIIEAWKHIGSIPKNGRNPKFNYAFVREEDAADALRHAFIKVGLACVPSVEKLERSVMETSSGAKMQHVIVTMKFTLTDRDTGESDTFIMVGEAADSFDKAVYKAITGCTKYAYVKLAMSGVEDNEDDDAGERPDHKPAAPKPVEQGATYRKPAQSGASAKKSSPPTNPQPVPAPQSEDPSVPAPHLPGSDHRQSAMPSTSSAPDATERTDIPVMKTNGYITAVVPAMKGKPSSFSLKSEHGATMVVTFDPATTNVPNLLKWQSSKAKVEVECDIASGHPHAMVVRSL